MSKLLSGYYRYGGYLSLGVKQADRTIPRFFVFKARDQDDPLGRKPRQWLEERVEMTFLGCLLTRPAVLVTDEHRNRWPEAYAAFRAELWFWVKLQLWWHEWRRSLLPAPQPHNAVLDEAFSAAQIEASAHMDRLTDNDIRTALDAAFCNNEEKIKS